MTTPSVTRPLPWPAGDAELAPFLPLIHVAWADGHLSAAELDAIRERIGRDNDLSAGARTILESWLRAEAPPDPSALVELRERIREVAARVPDRERRSLARLGAALARIDGEAGAKWSSERGMRTLAGIEELLGVLGDESARVLIDGETASADPTEPAPADSKDATEPFDVDRMRAILDGPHAGVRARIFDLLRDRVFRAPDGTAPGFEPMAEHRERTLAGLRALAADGFGVMGYPEEFGGTGDVAGSIIAFETLGYGDQSLLVKFGVQFGLFGGSVLQLGTRKHHERWLAPIGRLELPGCYAMTEVEHGSNVRELRTTADYLSDEDTFVIHTPHPGARKDWIGNAALHGRMATVFAQLRVAGEEHGVHAFLVPIRDDDGRVLRGITIEDRGTKIGLNGVDNGLISFDRVRIPRENLLDRFGRVTENGRYESPIPSSGRRFFTMLGTLVTGRISIAAASISAAKTALTIAVRYSDRRRQFGPSGAPQVPVLDYLTQQRLLLPRVAGCYAMHFAIRELVERYDAARTGDAEDRERNRIEVEAAGLKAYASHEAMGTMQAAREACGGQGYLADNRFGMLRADTDIFTTFEGANVVLMQLVAKGLLSRYQERMGDLNLRTMVRYLAERAGSEASRRNPVRSRRTSEGYLLDPGTHLDALHFREERLLHTAARRLKALLDDGVDSFDAMNRCQDHLVALANAHVESMMLECFHNAAADAPHAGNIRDGLKTLAAFWALSRIEEDRAWFLEAGYMEGSQTKAIRALVNRLCGELRPRSVALVNAFGIPEDLLHAPAALPDQPSVP